jgi:hypothetical protein
MSRLGRLRDWFLPALIHLDPMVAAAYSVAMDEASPDAGRTPPPRDALVSSALIGVAVFHLVELAPTAHRGVTRAVR